MEKEREKADLRMLDKVEEHVYDNTYVPDEEIPPDNATIVSHPARRKIPLIVFFGEWHRPMGTCIVLRGIDRRFRNPNMRSHWTLQSISSRRAYCRLQPRAAGTDILKNEQAKPDISAVSGSSLR